MGTYPAGQTADLGSLSSSQALTIVGMDVPGAAEYIPASFACRGFIEATVQYHDAVSDRKNLKRLICYPKTATVADGRGAFVAWAQKHATDKKLMNEVPVVGLVRALAERYPCR